MSDEPSEPPNGLFYYAAVERTLFRDPPFLSDSVECDGIRSVVESADGNFGLLFALLALPAHTFDLGDDWSTERHEAVEELTKHLPPTDGGDDSGEAEDEALSEAIADRTFERVGQRFVGGEGMVEMPLEQCYEELDIAAHNLSGAVDHFGYPGITNGLYALYSASIIQAWTIYESLAKDLWVAALNARPRLGLKALNAEVTTDDDAPKREGKRQKTFEVPTYVVNDPTFILNQRMGTLLKDKWKFSKRQSAAEAYYRVFGKKHASVAAAFFSQDIQHLCAVRNVFVHKAGVVDSEFMGAVAKHPVYGTLQEDERVPLNGILTAEMVNAAHNRASELVRFVDSWLMKNPT